MWCDVAAESYDRFMGRYAGPLADRFLDLARVRPGQRVLDVGCGPGTLTTRLVDRLGAAAVAAVDPSPPFLEAVRERCPGVVAREAAAEDLPFADGSFDVALASLVVHFMADPVAGLREMGRVVGTGGLVGASVWDHASETGPLATFWSTVRELDPGATTEAGLAGVAEGALAELCDDAGLRVVDVDRLTVTVGYESFAQWWEPFTLGVGPAGARVQALSADHREALRGTLERRLGTGAFEVRASAWTVLARP
ncbi:class I SAM-dependent methyltransferase [Nocardioides pantholopis]|uniref:class I SAM-dependent methyltransferase n=1 Tax=Nocardioides pantholopis TaxID=2483798 RepID=UPI000FD7C936|nr:class I SAM-dependent methyltransferase [Nocardioides pantholopis]